MAASTPRPRAQELQARTTAEMAASTPRPRAQELQARTTAEMAASTPRPRAQELQARTTAEMAASTPRPRAQELQARTTAEMAASTPRPRAQELQARTTAEVDKDSSSGGRTSGGAWRQAGWFRPLHLLLVFACLSPVTFSITKVEAGPSPVDSLLQDLTAVLERAQRLEQSGVPAFQQVRRHLDAFISQVDDAQKSLWEAVGRDDPRGLEAAVRRGADIEKRNSDKMSPLALAAKEGRVEAVWALLRLGAEVNSTAGERELSPLRWARLYKNKECETLLLAVGAHEGVDAYKGKVTRAEAQRQLWEGVAEDDVLKIEGAVLSGADLEEERDSDKKTPLIVAASEKRLEAVGTLLRLGARVEGRDGEWQGTALYWSSRKGHVAVVRELLVAGASVEARNKDSDTPLHIASYWGHVAVVRELLAAGASVRAEDRNIWTPLHVASSNGHVAVVRELLVAGASVEARNKDSDTPLHIASYWGHVAVVRELLAAGASVRAEDRNIWTPLHEASSNGHVAVVRELLAAGATVEAESISGITPLHKASEGGHEAVVRELLKAGASVGAETNYGYTPLHGATEKGHLAIARLLVEAGADLNPRNRFKKTPLALAVDWKHSDVADYLRSVGATT